MSVPDGLLVLLLEGPTHGYHLASDFAARTAGRWSLNTGQVYTTLDRLARDGFVAEDGTDPSDARRRRYRLTPEGEERAGRWLVEAPVPADQRDELVLRVLLTAAVDPARASAVVDVQRRQLVEQLRGVRQHQRAVADDLLERMAADASASRLEADLRWLDLCDDHLRSAGTPAHSASPEEDRR